MILNETTNENLKGTFRAFGNPFRRNYLTHWFEMCRLRNKKMLWKPKRITSSEAALEIDRKS